MTGRQITAPPEQPMRPFSVGKWRSVTIPVTVKGSRALLKVYTNVKVEADDPRVWYNMGLEPTIPLVSSLSFSDTVLRVIGLVDILPALDSV